MLSPKSILPPSPSHRTFIPHNGECGAFKKCYYFNLFTLVELRKSKSVYKIKNNNIKQIKNAPTKKNKTTNQK